MIRQPYLLKQLVIIFLVLMAIAAIWVAIDMPVGTEKIVRGKIIQYAYVPSRYSGGYYRTVVKIDDGMTVVFQDNGQTLLRPGMRVNVLVKQSRLSKLNTYMLQGH